MNVDTFLKNISTAMKKEEAENVFKMGTISVTYAAGRPTVVFYGETEETAKAYPYMSPYAPAAGDRVLLARVGHTWVVMGEVI